MNKSTLWTVIGVIAAVIIAWVLVDVLFSVLWFIGKLIIVAIVAAIVFFVLRSMFSSKQKLFRPRTRLERSRAAARCTVRRSRASR